MAKNKKFESPDLNVSGLLSRAAKTLKMIDGIELPAEVVTDIEQAVSRLQHVRAAEIKAPTVAELATKLAAGQAVTAEEVAAERAAARMQDIKNRAHEMALSTLDSIVAEHQDILIEAVAEQVAAPAIATLQAAAPLAGEDLGHLFTAGRDEEARTLRDATTAHTSLVHAFEVRRALLGRDARLGPCGAWMPHDELNAPDLDEHGAVTTWMEKLTEKQAKNFGECMDLVSRGCTPWLPTADQAAQAQGEAVAEYPGVPARMPQAYRVNGHATSWSNGSAQTRR